MVRFLSGLPEGTHCSMSLRSPPLAIRLCGRWGAALECGSLLPLSPSKLARAAGSVGGGARPAGLTKTAASCRSPKLSPTRQTVPDLKRQALQLPSALLLHRWMPASEPSSNDGFRRRKGAHQLAYRMPYSRRSHGTEADKSSARGRFLQMPSRGSSAVPGGNHHASFRYS